MGFRVSVWGYLGLQVVQGWKLANRALLFLWFSTGLNIHAVSSPFCGRCFCPLTLPPIFPQSEAVDAENAKPNMAQAVHSAQ